MYRGFVCVSMLACACINDLCVYQMMVCFCIDTLVCVSASIIWCVCLHQRFVCELIHVCLHRWFVQVRVNEIVRARLHQSLVCVPTSCSSCPFCFAPCVCLYPCFLFFISTGGGPRAAHGNHCRPAHQARQQLPRAQGGRQQRALHQGQGWQGQSGGSLDRSKISDGI